MTLNCAANHWWFRVIPGSGVEVKHPEWEGFLRRLIAKKAEYLGFGEAMLEPRLHALFLWEKDSLWREYQK